MAKERRKKVTEDLKKDLMSLAEDPEMFEETAPLLFGASLIEKKMKDHLESFKCLRQSMAPRSGCRSDQFFSRGPPPVFASERQQQLRWTEVPSLPPPKKWKRDSETVPEEGTANATEIVDSETVYVSGKALPVVHILPELKKVLPFSDSQSVNGSGDSSTSYRPETCNQSEQLKQVCLHIALQNGGYTHPERPAC